MPPTIADLRSLDRRPSVRKIVIICYSRRVIAASSSDTTEYKPGYKVPYVVGCIPSTLTLITRRYRRIVMRIRSPPSIQQCLQLPREHRPISFHVLMAELSAGILIIMCHLVGHRAGRDMGSSGSTVRPPSFLATPYLTITPHLGSYEGARAMVLPHHSLPSCKTGNVTMCADGI